MQGSERARNAGWTRARARRRQARIHRAADLPEACPEPPERLSGEGERATCDSLSQVPLDETRPRRQKLDLGRGTRTRGPANGTLTAPSHVGFVSG